MDGLCVNMILKAKDDRDPSQNTPRHGWLEVQKGEGGVADPGARTGDGTSGGLDGIQLGCYTDCTLYD